MLSIPLRSRATFDARLWAHRVGSLRRTDSVAIEGIADIGEALLPVGATRMTQLRHWPARLAVMHYRSVHAMVW